MVIIKFAGDRGQLDLVSVALQVGGPFTVTASPRGKVGDRLRISCSAPFPGNIGAPYAGHV